MEDQYLLSAFEVAELFCRVKIKNDLEINSLNSLALLINKYINIETKTPPPDQLNAFLKDCTRKYSEDFSIDKLSKIKRPGQNKHPRLLEDMRISIEDGMPISLSIEQLRALLNYLEIDFTKTGAYTPIEPQYLTEKQISFEGECWSIYYAGHDEKMQRRITHGILEFQSFGKVNIKFNTSSPGYAGKYRTYGKDEYYLLMELRSVPNRKKDMHILVYCGPDKPELMLGQFHNVEQNIKAGLIVLEPIIGNYVDLIPKHINNDDSTYTEIHPLVRRYFSEQTSKRLFSPVEIVTYAKLERYLEINKNIKW